MHCIKVTPTNVLSQLHNMGCNSIRNISKIFTQRKFDHGWTFYIDEYLFVYVDDDDDGHFRDRILK